jgi:chaperonin GroEL
LCARRSAPARQLALNAGEDGSIIVGKMIEKDRPVQLRVRLADRRIRQLVSKGIIDPTKMVRAAIQNAQLQEDRAEHRG